MRRAAGPLTAVLALCAGIGVLAAGLKGVDGTEPPGTGRVEVEFLDQLATPVRSGGAAVVTLRYRALGQDVRARAVRLHGDDHLLARYIGHSTCRHGCLGAGPWDAENRRLVLEGVEGRAPIPIDRRGTHHLILALRPGPAARQRLRDGCLRLRRIQFVLDDGSAIEAQPVTEDWFAGVERREPRPPTYRPCIARNSVGEGASARPG